MVVLAIHGGAGGDGPWKGQTDLDPARISCMNHVLTQIGSLLENGERATDAVAKAVSIMEDEPLFNAGRGSVISADGRITMDASIMRGIDKAAGAIVNVEQIRNPIFAAKILLEKGWPVMLNSKAADNFGFENGVENVSQEWLKTALRVAQWERWRKEKLRPGANDEDDEARLDHDGSFGTVGAVALDMHGNLAAATSTGGMTGKPNGRIGDTAIIGAGTWADDRVGVSCTGVGEAFIRTCAAHEVATQLRLGQNLEDACTNMLDMVAPFGGRGGVIAISSAGDVTVPFQTMLMYRGIWKNGQQKIGIGPSWI